MCWTIDGTDSTLTRYTFISSRPGTLPVTLIYRNAQGANVTPTGGRLAYGFCECCTRDTLPIPRIENYAESVPVPNPMDPGSLTACYRGQNAYVFGVTNPATQIVATSDGNPLTYVGDATAGLGEWSFNPATRFFRALSPNYGTGTGPHDMQFTITIPAGTTGRTLNFDCGE
jgi:hypothetical protein